MTESLDLSTTIAANSDQLGAEDFLAGPRLVTIDRVTKGTADQPVNIHLTEFPGRPFRPCKSMRRVLVAAWGKEAATYTGRRLMLFNDPSVRFGGSTVGGVRISAMSDISSRLTLALTVTRGKKAPYQVEPLPDLPPAITPETATEIQERINNATTLDDLKTIGAELKTTNLGEYREQIQAAWSRRKGEIEANTA